MKHCGNLSIRLSSISSGEDPVPTCFELHVWFHIIIIRKTTPQKYVFLYCFRKISRVSPPLNSPTTYEIINVLKTDNKQRIKILKIEKENNNTTTLKSHIQSTLVISTSVISSNRLSRGENLVPVLRWKSITRQQILWMRGKIAPQEQFLPFPTIFSKYIFISFVKFGCAICILSIMKI